MIRKARDESRGYVDSFPPVAHQYITQHTHQCWVPGYLFPEPPYPYSVRCLLSHLPVLFNIICQDERHPALRFLYQGSYGKCAQFTKTALLPDGIMRCSHKDSLF